MKTSVRFPAWLLGLVLILWFGAFGLFVSRWFTQQRALSEIAAQEIELRNDLDRLSTWGKWTIDFIKIDKALAYLSKDRLTEEQRALLSEQIWQISRSYAMDPLLILAVVAQESHGNPNARGKMRSGAESGAMGLMQIKLETAQMMAKHFGLRVDSEEDLMRPEVNVAVGTAYLIRLMGRYGSYKDALIAYNLGHSAVDRKLSRGEALPTRYYEHVISKYRKLARESFSNF